MKFIAISKPYVSLSQSSNMSAPIGNLVICSFLIWSSVYSIISTVWIPPWAIIRPQVNSVSSREWTIINPPRIRSPSTTASFFCGQSGIFSIPECRMCRIRTSGNGVFMDTRRYHPVWLEHCTANGCHSVTNVRMAKNKIAITGIGWDFVHWKWTWSDFQQSATEFNYPSANPQSFLIHLCA